MKYQTAADAWESFYDVLDLSKAHPTQQREMKSGFYAGYVACFSEIVQISEVNSEEDAAKCLTALEGEIWEWVAEKRKEGGDEIS